MEKNNGKEKRARELFAKEVQEEKANTVLKYNRNLLETSLDPLVTMGPDGIITDANYATEKATGLPREKIIGTDFSEYFTEPDKARAGYKQAFDVGKVLDYELYLKHINGSSIPVLYNVSVYKDNEGQIIGMFAAARDISAIKKYVDELIDFRNNLETIIQQKTAELITANKQLVIQNEEKEKRAEELVVANKELAFQNDEKDKRAAELVLANRELTFQNREKADRAAELVIADEELAFQTGEKADRAAELLIANKELVFQNEEKEKRAAELVITNKELALQSKEIKRRIKELALAKKQVDMAGVIINKAWKYDRSLIKASIDPIMTIDQDGLIVDVNTAVKNATGLPRKKLIGSNFSEIFSDQEKARNYSKTIFEKGQAFNFELDLKHTNGFTIPVIYNAFVYSDNKEKRVGVLVANNDNKTKQNDEIIYLQINLNQLVKQRTSELKIANKKLAIENEKNEYLGYHDHLTGLYNRRFFEEELKRLDTKTNLPISIIMCDTNGLKLINDSFGHNYGDKLLLKAAETIKMVCRADDIVARIGGDEFAVLLPKTDAEETMQIANNMKQLASKARIANIELSISYGYDTKTSDKQKTIEIMANAENHMYRHKLYDRSSIRNKTIDLIMNTLFEKSDRESQHSARASNICQAIASKMNFDKGDVNKVRIAGLVHDIGKMGIDENILNKAGKLSDFEWEQMKGHSEAGWRILSSANEFSELAQFVLDHHERWDGSGYPNGLKGEKIPLESRIIAVADSYDAMTSDRSYRKGLNKEEAIKEMKKCSGTQFDPEIVDVFVNQVLPYNSNFGGGKPLLSAVENNLESG